MFNLIFSSRAFRALSHDDLFLLLSQSRNNNQHLDITGVLLYSHNMFIQLIEGDKDVVLELYEKIKNDVRHRNVKLELTAKVEERIFPDWSMGFYEADETEKHNIPGFTRFLEFGFDISPLCKGGNNSLRPLLDFKQKAILENHI